MEKNQDEVPLFETQKFKGRLVYRLFATSIFIGIFFVLVYRVIQICRSLENGRWVLIGMLLAEIWFGFYWVLTQSARWSPVNRLTFPNRLSHRLINSPFFFAVLCSKLSLILVLKYG